MATITYWAISLAVAVGLVLFFYLKARKKARRDMYLVLWRLANQELDEPLPSLSVDAVQQRYVHLKEMVEELFKLARSTSEFSQCKAFERNLGEWRVRKIQEVYQAKLDSLLKKVRESHTPKERLDLLYQARELAREGLFEDPVLEKIEKWIVYTHIKEVRNKETGLPMNMKYRLYEEAITKILNSGIDDTKLESMREFKEFITDYEIMYRRLRKKE